MTDVERTHEDLLAEYYKQIRIINVPTWFPNMRRINAATVRIHQLEPLIAEAYERENG